MLLQKIKQVNLIRAVVVSFTKLLTDTSSYANLRKLYSQFFLFDLKEDF